MTRDLTRRGLTAKLNLVKTLPITVTIIVLNEEKNISRCIGSVPFASEVIVLDCSSVDRTVEIAKSLGAKVFTETWKGFGPQKASATTKASFDWILSLDADESVSPELRHEIETRFAGLDPQTGYLLPRKSFYLGRWILRGGWYPDYQKRLFHRAHSRWNDAQIHEKVISPKEEKFQQALQHYVFKNLEHQVQTNNRYSGLLAQTLKKDGQSFSFFKLLVKPISKFFETYFWKRGFLDGLPGLIISVSAGYSVFLKWAKLWEIETEVSKELL